MKEFNISDYNSTIDFTEYELTAKQAIIAKCHDCCVYQYSEVKQCDNKECSLYKFKEKWYKRQRKISDELKEKRRANIIINKKYK